jgi:predicted transcriptional regulator
MAKTLLTVRVDEERLEALDKVAAGLDRDRSYVVTQAIDAFLDAHRWQIQYIEEALRDADAGGLASEDEVDGVFARLRGRPKRRKTA